MSKDEKKDTVTTEKKTRKPRAKKVGESVGKLKVAIKSLFKVKEALDECAKTADQAEFYADKMEALAGVGNALIERQAKLIAGDKKF